MYVQDKNKDSEFRSTATKCKLFLKKQVWLEGNRKVGGSLYKVNFRVLVPHEVNAAVNENTLQLYHERWGHQNKRFVKEKLRNDLGIDVKMDQAICEPCIYGKMHRQSFGTRQKVSKPGELMSADVVGPFKESFGKNKYVVIFKDSYSKFCFGFFMKTKSEVKDALQEVLQLAKTHGNPIVELLSDNGGEFDNFDVRRLLKKHGVIQRLTAPYTPQQNGSSERENRTVIEMARTLRYTSKVQFPDAAWGELVRTSIYILNAQEKPQFLIKVHTSFGLERSQGFVT